ncbi:sugar phosphate isomerase/epimerase family protein [Thalassobacillus pellis]|uniref:sugar phosphate isomerase/epimerase family protein n=1 Tax=Thalassobacillus pellis TaxID=748008 RepID=UPI001960B26F|nr:sugar phosphate isomerase/epimerase [Thalassobacillus pellis]MBM7553384.1 sugar phosphate isomerase/epimerase [Thalassobacillus pellis]
MKLATQDKPFFPTDFKDKFDYVRGLGFEAFEIDGKDLVRNFEEVKAASEQASLPVVTACGGYNGWIGDFDEKKRENGIREIQEILKCLGEIGGKGIVIPAAWGMFSKRLPPMVPPRTEQEDREVLLDSLGKLNETAVETDTKIYLEPLNRYEDYMINKLQYAQELIKEGNFSSVEIIADFFHMNIEEPKMDESLTAVKEQLGHVHIADSNRFEPGNAHLDFLPGFEALKQIGYEGYLAFECRVLGEPAEERYAQSVTYIKKCLKEIGVS